MDDQAKPSTRNDELERALRDLRRDAARERMQRIAADLTGATECSRAPEEAAVLSPAERWQPATAPRVRPVASASARASRKPTSWANRALLLLEVLALVGLVAIVLLSWESLRRLQEDLFRAPKGWTASNLPVLLATVEAGPPITVTRTPTATTTPALAPVAALPVTATVTVTASSAVLPASTGSPTATALASPSVLPGGSSSPAPIRTAATAAPGEPPPTITPGATPVSPTGFRVAIPAINVDAPIVEGDDWGQLKLGVGHHIGSPWPGEQGNAVLSAHDDVYGSIFRDLHKLEPGDLVYVHAPKGTFTYRVLFSRLVLPTEVSVLAPTSQAILTLITCYPPHTDTHRIVVTAQLIE